LGLLAFSPNLLSHNSHNKGNKLNFFPSLVKFPTLSDLEKAEGPCPEIPIEMLQERARQCGVPCEEVTLELLHNKSTRGGRKESSSGQGELEISNEV
jgi:hypothetical protein